MGEMGSAACLKWVFLQVNGTSSPSVDSKYECQRLTGSSNMSAMRKLWSDPEFLRMIDAIRNPGVQPGGNGSVPVSSSAPTQMPPTELYPFGDPNNPIMPEIPKAPKLPEFPQEVLPNEPDFDPFEEIDPETEPAITRVAQRAEPYVEPTPTLVSPQAQVPPPADPPRRIGWNASEAEPGEQPNTKPFTPDPFAADPPPAELEPNTEMNAQRIGWNAAEQLPADSEAGLVTNRLPIPEGSNGAVTLRSPQGPVPTPEPTPPLVSPQAPEAPPSADFEVEPVTNRLPTPEGGNGPVTLRSPQGPVPTPEPTPNVTLTDPPPPEAVQTTRLPRAPQPVPEGGNGPVTLQSPQVPAAPPSAEPVTNRLPTPEGSNGPVTLRSPQGPVPTPEPTPNVTVTDAPPPEAVQTTRLPRAPEPVPEGSNGPVTLRSPQGPVPTPEPTPSITVETPQYGPDAADGLLRARGIDPNPPRPLPNPEADLEGYV